MYIYVIKGLMRQQRQHETTQVETQDNMKQHIFLNNNKQRETTGNNGKQHDPQRGQAKEGEP